MKKASHIRRKLQHILQNRTFDSLDDYTQAQTWEVLSDEDRELLGLLFIMRGEDLLKAGHSKAIECFEHAKNAAPNSPKVFYRLGTALSTQAQNAGCLEAACKSFQRALELEPSSANSLHAWGNTLIKKGLCLNEHHYFQEAQENFANACKSLANFSEASRGEFYWHWGQSWYLLGKNSGEAADFHYALEKYRIALQEGINESEFWKDYGDVHFELAPLVNRTGLYAEAVDHYQKAVKLCPDFFEGWLSLALCYQQLFELQNEPGYFELANASFENASKLSDDSLLLFYKWGLLLFMRGKQKYDLECLQDSLDKFRKADQLEPRLPAVLSRWAEAEMVYASYTERVDLLREAESKMITSLKIQPGSFELLHLYGTCLNELGRYFEDEQFYIQAIEKFQHGLSLNDAFPFLWHGMALSCFAIGELNYDLQMIEKSVGYCAKAHECGIPQISEFWTDWGIALMKMAEMTEDKNCVEVAIEKFERAIIADKKGRNNQALDAELLYNYGCALDFLGDFYEETSYYEKAIQVLSKAVQLEPNHLHIRYNLALAFSHLGELAADVDCFHKAIEHFQVLLSLDGEDEMAWNEYGLTLLNLAQLLQDPALPDKSAGYYEQAELKLMQALTLGCVQACYNLACLYSLTGNYSAAMFYLEKAEVSGSLPPLDDVIQDEWLEGLRHTQVFKAFISHLSGKNKKFDR